MSWRCRNWKIRLGKFLIHGTSSHPVSGNTCRIGCHFHFITGETEFKHSWPRTIWHVPSKPRSESGLSCFQNGVIIPACCFLAFIEGTSDSLAHSTTLQFHNHLFSTGVPSPWRVGMSPALRKHLEQPRGPEHVGSKVAHWWSTFHPQASSMLSTCKPHTAYFYHYIIWTDWW